jgi:signal peptidase II
VVMVSVILLGLLLYILKSLQTMPTTLLVALSLFLGGGLGNLIDRIFNDGRVVDFVNIGIGSLRTGVFNVADVALMTGLAIIVLFSFRRTEHEPVASDL